MKFRIVLSCAVAFTTSLVFGWGSGHDTVARETLRVMPGVWGERLRAGEEGKLFIKSCHAPDDQKTALADRAQYLDEEFRAAVDEQKDRPTVMYRLHVPEARCELIRAMARAMKRDDLASLSFLLACFNHSVADTVSANHSPLLQMVTYNWLALGFEGKVEADCIVLEKSEATQAIMRRETDALDLTLSDASPDAVFKACYDDELQGMSYFRYDVDLVNGGEKAYAAFASEVAYAVKRSVEAVLAAEAFAKLPEIPAFDKAVQAKRAQVDAHAYLAARSMHDDALTQGLVPADGDVPEIGVIYDPTGFWTRGIVYMANRTFAAQVCTTLKKNRSAGLLDIREIMKKGVPAGVKTIVFPASGFGSHQGFQAKDVSKALADFMQAGGRLIWLGGNPAPTPDLFPEGKQFVKNPAANPWAHMRGPVAAVDMPGGRLLLPKGASFTCLRPPKGGAGWYWDQLGFNYLLPETLPEGAREELAFVTKEGVRTTVGYTVGNRTFLPSFALYPFVFTDEKPQLNPVRIELDSAGAAILESVLGK